MKHFFIGLYRAVWIMLMGFPALLIAAIVETGGGSFIETMYRFFPWTREK